MICKITKSITMCVLILFLICSSSISAPLKRLPQVIKWPSKPGIVKIKLYRGDTIAIIWYNIKGDSRCDIAELYCKEDGYFIKKNLSCKQADEMDAYIFEPHI